MSAFKRYQSKVFWDQMALNDLEEDHFVGRSDRNRYCLSEHFQEDKKNSTKSENDTVDDANITAIRVYNISDENLKQDACQISPICDENVVPLRMKESEEEIEKEVNEEVDVCEIIKMTRNRCHSPLSQDFRSQDSGFSDSERSNYSETCVENATPRRKLRRKRTRRRRIQSTGPVSPWLEERSPLMRTSTPKDSRTYFARNYFEKSAREPFQDQRIQDQEQQSNASKVSLFISLEGDECLGDFLYISEPPEDSIQSSIVKLQSSINVADVIASGKDVLNSRNYRQSSSMRTWLTDLATETENECGSTLQSKNLPRGSVQILSGEIDVRDLKILFSAATAAASKLLVTAEHFEQYYQSIIEKIIRLEGGRSEMELLRSIEETAFTILSELGAPPPRRIQQGSPRNILAQLESMKIYVDGTIDTRLDLYIEKIVRGLEEAPWEDSGMARGALAALTALGLSDSRAGSSIARCSGIKVLLMCLVSADRNDFVAIALRALASVCCSKTAIEYLARDGGPEILVDLLAAQTSSEKEKTEAIALVVQITAPWTYARGLPYLEPFAISLIPALNELVESTSCAQTLLLAAAALNNLSKSKLCIDIILKEDSVKKLLKSVKKSSGGNVWLMEQVAALIGELARVSEGRSHLAKVRASVALVSFLRMRPPGLEDAYKQLEMTTTAALTRLCVEPEIARQVVAIGGADFLSGPCRLQNAQLDRHEEDVEKEKGPVQMGPGLLKYTRSLRRACKKAAKQLGIAKAKDYSILD